MSLCKHHSAVYCSSYLSTSSLMKQEKNELEEKYNALKRKYEFAE